MASSSFDELADKVRNWGRWGADDQRGTLNHIGPDTLAAAAATVTSGKLFSLALRFDRNGPQMGKRRFNPMLYPTELFTLLDPTRPRAAYSDDVIHMPLQAATQWDALAHVHYDGVLYNGHKASETFDTTGTARCGVEHLASPGILSRAILLDIARLKSVDVLPVDYVIEPDDLNEAAARQGVVPSRGDILMVRTGHIRRFTVERDRKAFNGTQPGLSHRCAEWVFDRSIAAIAADNVAVEAITPATLREEMPLPLHMLALRDMGCPLGEMFDMEALAADCAGDGRYTFMLCAPPLPVTGAFGSPVNPLVLK